MNIFNSLGSNYDLNYVLHSLTAIFKRSATDQLKEWLEKKYQGKVVLLYKGREAIELALKLSNLEKDSYVAVNGYTCYVVEKAISNAGLRCEFLDIDSDLNFSANTLERALIRNKKIKAVIIQNTLGNPSDFKNIQKVCKANNLVLIEDLAHSLITHDADFSALSFSQDKIIDSVSGGALIIKNKKYSRNVEAINLSSIPKKYLIKDILYPLITYLIRFTYPFGIGRFIHFISKKINILSAPMGFDDGKLHTLPSWHTNMACYYLEKINNVESHRSEIIGIYGGRNVNIRYPVLVNKPKEFVKYMKQNGVYISDTWYDHPVAPKKTGSATSYKEGTCPNAEKISQKMVNLPTHVNLNIDDAKEIINLTRKWQNTH